MFKDILIALLMSECLCLLVLMWSALALVLTEFVSEEFRLDIGQILRYMSRGR